MFGSLKLGRLFGIDLFVHGTFWLLPAFVLFGGLASGDDVTLDLAVLFAVFGCVALHELGHAAAASWYGIRTRDITLYPIGGVARLEGMPERPWPEIVVALAGPVVNVAIAGVLALLLAAGGFFGRYALTADPFLGEFLERLFVTNVFLVLFNLIPAFPMDGGRVLRAGVHLFTDRVTATEVATTVGAVAAGLMVLGGLFIPNPMISVIGAAVFLMGRAELAQVRYQARGGRWPDYEIPTPRRRVVADPLNGWEWNPANREWTEYRNGFPVRRWPAG
jgi:Zn-dependent protease